MINNLVAVGLVLAAVGGAAGYGVTAVYRAGGKAAENRCATEKAAAKADIDAREKQLAEAQALLRTAGALRQVQTQTVFQTLEKEVIRYVETAPADVRGCGLDADGLRLWNAANAGAADTDGRPGGSRAVLDVVAGAGWAVDHAAGEPPPDSGELPRVPGPPPAPGRSPAVAAAAQSAGWDFD